MVLGLVTRWARARGPKRPPKTWRLAVPVALLGVSVEAVYEVLDASPPEIGQT
jgi:hypothetical protein